jgi:hypothetical protein
MLVTGGSARASGGMPHGAGVGLRITGLDCPRRGSIAQITNLLARARPSSALARSRSTHRPKHYTKHPIFGGMENAVAQRQTLPSSPTSISQSSGASRMGSQGMAPHDILHT